MLSDFRFSTRRGRRISTTCLTFMYLIIESNTHDDVIYLLFCTKKKKIQYIKKYNHDTYVQTYSIWLGRQKKNQTAVFTSHTYDSNNNKMHLTFLLSSFVLLIWATPHNKYSICLHFSCSFSDYFVLTLDYCNPLFYQ